MDILKKFAKWILREEIKQMRGDNYTAEDMVKDPFLEHGDIVTTSGYSEPGDGCNNTYQIIRNPRTSSDDGVSSIYMIKSKLRAIAQFKFGS